MRIWRKCRELPWKERLVLLLAFGVLPAVVALLRMIGYRRTQAVLGWLSPSPLALTFASADLARLRGYGAATNLAANRCLVHANCLPRSLFFWWLLRFLGCPARVRFGVNKHQEHLQAHAWVEFNGQPLNDQPDVAERYLPLDYAAALDMELGA